MKGSRAGRGYHAIANQGDTVRVHGLQLAKEPRRLASWLASWGAVFSVKGVQTQFLRTRIRPGEAGSEGTSSEDCVPPGPWFDLGRAERLAIRFNPSGPFDGRSTSDVSAIVSSRQSKCRGE